MLVIYTFPALALFTAVLLTVIIGTLLASLLTGLRARDTLLRTNPFAAYEALWPGQPLSSILAYGRSTPKGYMVCLSAPAWNPQSLQYLGWGPGLVHGASSDHKVRCGDVPDDGVFSGLILTIDDDRVEELQLISTVLDHDSLIWHWGLPDAITRTVVDHFYELTWVRTTYRAIALVDLPSAMVKRVSLTAQSNGSDRGS